MGAYPLQARDGTRTHDLFLTKEVLCRLSYASTRPTNRLVQHYWVQYRQGDSNPRYRRERAASWASRRWRRYFSGAGQEGIEPPTAGFGDRCSTN